MSSIFKLPGRALVTALALGTLALCGCTDHGPVGIYSQELFNKTIPPPRLDYSSASALTFTPGSQGGSSVGGMSNLFAATVYIANFGNSSTYGPVLCTFLSPDPNIYFILTNSSNQAQPQGTPWGTGGLNPQAVADNSPGTEIPANSASLIALLRGYQYNGSYFVTDATNSFQATYYYAPVYNNNTHFVPVYMILKDAIGNTWNTQFTIYVVT